MSFLDRLFRRQKPKSGPEVFEELLRDHLSRMKSQFAKVQGFATTKPHWDKLLSPDILTFTTSVMEREMKESRQDHKHHYQGRMFGDIYVVVSTIPVVNPAQAVTYFVGGYLACLDDLLISQPGFHHDYCDVAHWVFCYDGEQTAVHLTFLPAAKLVERQDMISLVAQDLMTAAEKSQMFGRKKDSSPKKESGPTCSTCGSRIDHFGFTSDDIKVTMSVTMGRGSVSESKIATFEAMMKSVGGRCPQCKAICCAQCYGDHQQKCPHCGSRMPDFR